MEVTVFKCIFNCISGLFNLGSKCTESTEIMKTQINCCNVLNSTFLQCSYVDIMEVILATTKNKAFTSLPW